MQILEIGIEKDYVHFIVKTIPMMSLKQVAQVIKSITAREVFKRCPEIKNILWGRKILTSVHYLGSVGKYGNEDMIIEYVKKQGKKLRLIADSCG